MTIKVRAISFRAFCVVAAMIGAVGASYADDDISAETNESTVTVNCDLGESLTKALRKLDRLNSATVQVKGTCKEYVELIGLDDLKLIGLPGAVLLQPDTNPQPAAFGEVGVLTIIGSRGIKVKGLQVISTGAAGVLGIAIGHGSSDIRLHRLTVEGGGSNIVVFSGSQVYMKDVTARNPGWAALGVYDLSNVSLENNILFENTADGVFRAGIHVTKALVTMSGTTIRNMQLGITVDTAGTVDIFNFRNYPAGDVVIENPSAFNFQGITLNGGSTFTAYTKLRIINPGTGVLLDGNSTFNTGLNLEISGSRDQGVHVSNNSHASFARPSGFVPGAGSRIVGSGANGLVAVNGSTVELGFPIEITGSSRTDIFCDSRSLITNGFSLQNDPVVQCNNLIDGSSEPIP